jgi:hypothetical protein
MNLKTTTFAVVLYVMLFVLFVDYTFVLALEIAIFFIFTIWYTCISGNSFSDKEINRWDQIASSTTVIINIAIDHILGRKRYIYFTLCLLAKSIAENTSRCECPACSTIPLFKNICIAIRKLFSDIIRHRQIRIPFNHFSEDWFRLLVSRR